MTPRKEMIEIPGDEYFLLLVSTHVTFESQRLKFIFNIQNDMSMIIIK